MPVSRNGRWSLGFRRKTAGPGKDPSLKYHPPPELEETLRTGTRPVADAVSIQHVMSMMVVHLTRKILFDIDIAYKVGLYVLAVMILSVVGDFSELSNNYMSDPNNILNQYFVKLGWGWTLLVCGPFTLVTSYTYGCGNARVVRNQVVRLVVATAVWYAMTALFALMEDNSGICNVTKFLDREECVSGGFRWKGLDISGHCFLLVFSNLVLIEEASAYLGWEKIKELIRHEQHRRMSIGTKNESDMGHNVNALSKLKLGEFLHLCSNYTQFTPWIRCLFILMGLLVLLWDVMLLTTALYFHVMIEKVIATLAAIVAWFCLYRGIYTHPWSTGLPGQGPFKYVLPKSRDRPVARKESLRQRDTTKSNKWSARDSMPTFMGMPMYGANRRNVADTNDSIQSPIDSSAIQRPSRRSRSRSANQGSKNSLNAKY